MKVEYLGDRLSGQPFEEMVKQELVRARAGHGKITGAHDGYGRILEELDEFWEHVRAHEPRDRKGMLEELVQVAAMAQRTAEDLKLI